MMKHRSLYSIAILFIPLLYGCGTAKQQMDFALDIPDDDRDSTLMDVDLNADSNVGFDIDLTADLEEIVDAVVGFVTNTPAVDMDIQKSELEQISGAQVEMSADGEVIKVTFSSAALFAINSSTLKVDSKPTLKTLAASLANSPGTNVDVIGYTDNEGSDEINLPLSEQRAHSVRNLLASHGVAPGRLTAVGKGAANPVADNSTNAGKQQNRRIEVYISLPKKK
ncbi:hypothetical protein SAMD00024442_109_4 [Candidatus Symbiothrix dinenymphae]|nr:hypothetical protein SAMD00024442_109_4 [Candidatus Symbiothrix dinenymphae]